MFTSARPAILYLGKINLYCNEYYFVILFCYLSAKISNNNPAMLVTLIIYKNSKCIFFFQSKMIRNATYDLYFSWYVMIEKIKNVLHIIIHNPKITKTIIFEKIMGLFLERFASIRFLQHKFKRCLKNMCSKMTKND